MIRLTEEEAVAAFQKMGLGTEADRARFTQYADLGSPEDGPEFTLLDSTTQITEGDDAELA